MGHAKFLEPFHLINAASMGASVTSDPVIVKRTDNFGLNFRWTGTPTGTFSVQVTVKDPNASDVSQRPTNSDWEGLGAPSTNPSGSAGGYTLNINQLPFTAFRVVYTRTSGSGTLDVWVNGKSI